MNNITINNNTPFHIKIFKADPEGNLGQFLNKLEPYASYHQDKTGITNFIATFASYRLFEIKKFDVSKPVIEIGHIDLKSPKFPTGLNPNAMSDLIFSGRNVCVEEIGQDGQTLKTIDINSNAFESASQCKFYRMRVQKEVDSTQSLMGYFVTGTQNQAEDLNSDYVYFFDYTFPVNTFAPNNLYKSVKSQTWFVPNYIKGNTSDGMHKITTGSAKGRIINNGKDIHLYSGEVAIFENINYNEIKGDFWILKNFDSANNFWGWNNLNAFYFADGENSSIPSTSQSIKLGPGTMATFYSGINQGGASSQEIGSACAKLNFRALSFKTAKLESANSAGLNIFTEVAEQHQPSGTFYRTTVVGNAYMLKKSMTNYNDEDDIKNGPSSLQPGRPEYLYIESEEPVTAIINGVTKSLSTLPTRVKFNDIGNVEILIANDKGNNSIRVPNLFFRTEKMPIDLKVTADPNIHVHKRLADGKMQLGKFSSPMDLRKQKDKLGVDPNVSDDQWNKVVNVTQQANQSVVHAHRHDAASLHVKDSVDGSHIKNFKDIKIDFKKGSNKHFDIQTDVGLYKKYAKGKNLKSAKNSTQAMLFTDSLALEANLNLGSIWGDIANIVITVGQAVEDGIEDAVHIIVTTVKNDIKKFKHMIVSAASDIAHILTQIYDAVKLAITKLIDFIKFLIELLEDVPYTCDAISNTVIKGANKFKSFLSAEESVVQGEISSFIKNITGTTYAPASTSTASHASKSDMSSAFEKLHWLLNLITNGLSPSNIPSGGGTKNPMVDDIAKISEIILKDGKDSIEELVKDPAHPGKTAHQSIQSLIGNLETDVNNLVGDTLSVFRKFDAVEALGESIDSDLPEPLKSVLDTIVKLFGKKELTPLTIVSGVVALPTTLLYAIIFGKPPYQNSGENFWPSNFISPDKNLMIDAELVANVDEVMIKQMAYSCGIVSDLFSAATTPLTIINAKNEKKNTSNDRAKFLGKFLGAFKFTSSVVASIACFSVWQDNADNSIRNGLLMLSLFRGTWGVWYGKSIGVNNIARATCVIDSILGLIKISAGVYLVIEAENAAKCLIPLSEGVSSMCELDGLDEAMSNVDIVIIGASAITPLIAVGCKVDLLCKLN